METPEQMFESPDNSAGLSLSSERAMGPFRKLSVVVPVLNEAAQKWGHIGIHSCVPRSWDFTARESAGINSPGSMGPWFPIEGQPGDHFAQWRIRFLRGSATLSLRRCDSASGLF